MNWGMRIVIGMITAMSAVVFAVVYMVSHDTDTLEDSDYYEKGLSYDTAYTKKMNVSRDHSKAELELAKDSLFIRFTKSANVGTLFFRRAADGSMDRKVKFETAELNSYRMPIDYLKKGAWRIELEWVQAGVSYLQEQELYIK